MIATPTLNPANLVRLWAHARANTYDGPKTDRDRAKAAEALQCADAMDAYRDARETRKNEAAGE